MKLKRMTIVAAAAMVGPTLLAATPAMADDQPAVTVPDAAPKDDAAPAGTEAETAPAPTTETAPAPATVPVTPPAAQPAASAPAPAQAPAAETTAVAQGAADAPRDSILLGPDVTVAGIPKTGFKADGSWTPLTVTVDNSAHVEVTNYTPRITISQDAGKLKADRVKVEYLATDAAGNKSWTPATFTAGYNDNYFTFGLGTKASVARESVSTIDVRISFAADTAVVPFKLSSDGLSIRADGGNAWTATTWYETSIAGATADPTNPELVDGPSLSLTGVPAGGFKAGGDWQEIGVHVDNTGKQALKEFSVAFTLARPDFTQLEPEHVEVEIYGPNGWARVNHSYSDMGFVYFEIRSPGPIAAGQVADVKLRVRFTKDAPLGDIVLRAAGGAEDLGSGEHHVYVLSPSQGRLTTVVAADTNTGNQPKPDGGAQPIGQTGTGTGTGSQTGGELAATGSSPATTWALGGAGVALAMGAALVAGTGRRRRPTA